VRGFSLSIKLGPRPGVRRVAQRHHGAGFVSHIENYWDEPRLVRWLNKLGSFCRVDLFGKRGTVLSNWVSHLPAMDDEWTISPLSWTRLALSARLDLPKVARSPRFLLTVIPNRASRYILYVAFATRCYVFGNITGTLFVCSSG